MSLGALAMLSSLIQNAQSTAGTLISAFGNSERAVGILDAVGVVGVQVRDDDDVDRLGIDAGRRHVARPAGRPSAFGAGPKPVSISTSFEPVLISCGLNGTVTMPLGM